VATHAAPRRSIGRKTLCRLSRGSVGCRGVQPAVLAAVERGGV